jgi:hypothetical protein
VAGVEVAMEKRKGPARGCRMLEWSWIKGRWRSGGHDEEAKGPAPGWKMLEWSCIKGRWRSGRSGGRNGEAKGTGAGV